MSNGVVQPEEIQISPASEELKEWVMNIEATAATSLRLRSFSEPDHQMKKLPSIYGNWKCFDDHFPNVPFLSEINMWQFVAYMKNYNLNVQSYLEDLQEKEDDLWSYYEGVHEEFHAENGKRFVEYLLANSCFLIFALVILSGRGDKKIQIFHESAENDDSKMRTFNEFKNLEKLIWGKQRGIQRYMLTMDYQIPWFVVEAVYTKHSNVSSQLNTPIHELVISAFEFINPRVPKSKLYNNTITVPQDGFQHLLHIFHWSRTPEGKFHEIFSFSIMIGYNLPSATYLQLHATVFHEHDTSGFDVTYYERILSGVLQLPPISHFLYENEIYKDLLAFERGYGRVCGFSVTSYIACIVSLVKTAEDVKLLQANGLLPNKKNDLLSSVQGYKTILLSNDIPQPRDLLLMEVDVRYHLAKRSSIKKYYADFKKYNADYRRRYCSNPWITLSVVGGILLFFFTFIQTVLSFIQIKYSMLSYKNQ